MLMSLSLRITSSRKSCATPALFKPSNAMPAVMAPSPITAMLWRSQASCRAAMAIPSAAEILVDECAVPKLSYSLSARLGKPLKPPSWRRLPMRPLRPVSILCV